MHSKESGIDHASKEGKYILREGIMERVLGWVVNVFLSAANTFGQVANAIYAYLIDRDSEDDHSTRRDEPVMSSQPSNPFRVNSRIILFPTPASYKRSRIHGQDHEF
jgi:hypothetical protein